MKAGRRSEEEFLTTEDAEDTEEEWGLMIRLRQGYDGQVDDFGLLVS
jgi:hypothetical protein